MKSAEPGTHSSGIGAGLARRLRHFASHTLRNHVYHTGQLYRIPLGRNRGTYIEFVEGSNLDLMLGLHEANTLELLHQALQPGDTVFDIGANFGYFTAYCSRLVGPAGSVWAFEPVAAVFESLERACRKNQSNNVHLLQKAVSDHCGRVEFYVSDNPFMSSVDAGWVKKDTQAISVECVAIDSLVFDAPDGDRPKPPRLIKIDIEGGGGDALKGMERTIRKYAPVLLLEGHTVAEGNAIGQALGWADYAVYRVGDPTPVKHLDRDYTDPYGIYATVVGIPRSDVELVKRIHPAQFQKQRFGQRELGWIQALHAKQGK